MIPIVDHNCCIESCEETALFFDDMDNPLCEYHMEKDMEEMNNIPEDYSEI